MENVLVDSYSQIRSLSTRGPAGAQFGPVFFNFRAV